MPQPSPCRRAQAFAILRRALRTFPEFVTLVSDRVTPSERNGETAASLVTVKLRELVGPLNLPAGTIMAAHSIREMAAVATFRRGGSELRATERGFWKNPQIMWTSYIEPYLWFPVSPLFGCDTSPLVANKAVAAKARRREGRE